MRYLSLSLGCLILSSTCLAQTWIKMQPKTSPKARWSHGMAFDFIRGHTLVFGGQDASNVFINDTWAYDGQTWTQFQPKTVPAARRLHTMVNALTRTVMFGGWDANGAYLNETWVWDGKDWTQVKTTNAPSGRAVPGMAYDSIRNVVVLFGGFPQGGVSNDTWEFDFKNWTKITTKNAPSARYAPMVYDSSRKRVVLFGSSARSDDTWEYDGKDWTQMNPKTKPPARCCHSMAYDPARKVSIIFGGLPFSNDTWEWNGTDWKQVNPNISPSPRREFDGMVYDTRRQRIVYFGGLISGKTPPHTAETWEFVGSQALTGTPASISIASGGAHGFKLDAGAGHGQRLYWIFGSITGTSPGVTLASAAGSVNIPLNPDIWTDLTIALANTGLLTNTRGALDNAGKATATLNVPKITNQSAIGVKFYHAFLVYDANGNFYMASNPVELTLTK